MAYTGNSIVDYLKSIGVDSSFAARKKYAANYGITNYTGTAAQNLKLLSLIRENNGAIAPSPAPTNAQAAPAQPTPQAPAPTNAQAAPAQPTPQDLLNALPAAIKNSDDFKNLSYDLQLGLAKYFNIADQVSAEKALKDWNDTLEVAKNQAEPYYKTLFNIATDQLQRDISTLQNQYNPTVQATDNQIRKLLEDLETGKRRYDEEFQEQLASLQLDREAAKGTLDYNINQLDTRIKQLQEDLIRNKEYLTLEQQSALSDQLRNYKKQVDNMRETMAQRGLSESTIKEEAKKELEAEHQSVITGIQRKYEYQVQTEELTAQRGIQQSEAEKANLERLYQIDLQKFQQQQQQLESAYRYNLQVLESSTSYDVKQQESRKQQLQQQLNQSITQAARDFETKWGKEKLPSISGYTPLGITWEQSSMYETQNKDIFATRQTLIEGLARTGLDIYGK